MNKGRSEVGMSVSYYFFGGIQALTDDELEVSFGLSKIFQMRERISHFQSLFYDMIQT